MVAEPFQKQKREPRPSRFTDRYIKSLKPKSQMFQVREGRGFAIRILPSGVKIWYYIYNFQGKRRQLNLGNYPDVSLEEAHSKFRAAVDLVASGIDPMVPQKATPETMEAPTVTVSIMKNEYIQ